MITAQDNGHKRQFSVDSITKGRLLIAAFALMALILGAVGLTKVAFPDQAAVESAAPLADPVLATTSETVYLYTRHHDNQNYVLTIDPQTGKVNKSFGVGYDATVKLTTDKRILYAFSAGKISALDTQTGAALWTAHLPGFSFAGQPTNGAWLSADEKLLYLQASSDGFQPRIFVVDTQTQTLVHDVELPLPYPANVDQAFPIIWKLPWAETLVVISRDLLFTFDPASGKEDNTVTLFTRESIERVPKNLPQTAYIHAGELDPGTRMLFLATSTQEILSVNLGSQPFIVSRVLSLPVGWQFGVMDPLLLDPTHQTMSFQVRRNETPIGNGLEVDEMWVYNTANWTENFRVNLPDQATNTLGDTGENSYTSYGLAAADNGRIVFSLTPQGLLGLTQGPASQLSVNWLHVDELSSNVARVFALE